MFLLVYHFNAFDKHVNVLNVQAGELLYFIFHFAHQIVGNRNDAAAEHGKDADANDTGDGIYVDGIVITAATITAYNEAANNYTLTAVPGQLTVSATDVVEFDAKAEDNSTEDVFDNANRKLNVTILNKKLKAGRWYTISLPFATILPFDRKKARSPKTAGGWKRITCSQRPSEPCRP